MKRINIVGLCLAAVFALSAMAASSASAAGLLLARIAPNGGSPAGVSFLSLGELALLTTESGKLVDCKHVRDHGLWLSPTLGDVLILFLNCHAVAIGSPACTSGGGAGSEEIHLPLESTLFHLGLAHLPLEGATLDSVPAILILLHKDVFFNCGKGVAEVLVLGAVIGALQLDEPLELPIPLNTRFSTALLNFTQDAHGLQHLRLFLFEDSLNSYDLHSLITELGTIKPLTLSAEVALALLDLFTLGSPAKHVELELFEH
jgi:hypothetical protein